MIGRAIDWCVYILIADNYFNINAM